MRPAHTLPELALTVALLGLVTAISVPAVAATTARWELRAAVADVVNALVFAREAAQARGAVAAFVVDGPHGEVTVTCQGDTLAQRSIGARHGVRLAASSDTVRYAPDGMATGVSNTTVLVTRGTRVDSVVVSRLGRVRWVD